MYKRYGGIFAVTLLISTGQTADAGGPSGALRAEGPAPLILSANLDTVQRQLVISGAYVGRLSPTGGAAERFPGSPSQTAEGGAEPAPTSDAAGSAPPRAGCREPSRPELRPTGQ